MVIHIYRDHSGRNEEMKKLIPKIKIYGGIYDEVQSCTHKVNDGDKILLGIDIKISCILTPRYVRIVIVHYIRTIYIYIIC